MREWDGTWRTSTHPKPNAFPQGRNQAHAVVRSLGRRIAVPRSAARWSDCTGVHHGRLLQLLAGAALDRSWRSSPPTRRSISPRASRPRKGRSAQLWLVGGAFSMGVGIWSMHFIGMLAFSLPIPMGYDVPITLLSMLIAIVVSGFALFIVSREHAQRAEPGWSAAILMGIGICAMHYTGMAAMETSPADHATTRCSSRPRSRSRSSRRSPRSGSRSTCAPTSNVDDLREARQRGDHGLRASPACTTRAWRRRTSPPTRSA